MSEGEADGLLTVQLIEATHALHRAAIALEGVRSDGKAPSALRCPPRDAVARAIGTPGTLDRMHPLSVAGRTADDLNRMVVDGISEAVSVIRGALPLICEPVAAERIGQGIDRPKVSCSG
jgi:hypothetical protein